MEITKLSDTLGVASQIRPAAVPEIARAGFRSIICNRPDGEEQNQPAAAEVDAAAKAAGLKFAYIPAVAGAVTDADARLMERALAGLPKPILAYCRSGARSTELIEMAGTMAPAQREAKTYDIEPFVKPHPIGS